MTIPTLSIPAPLAFDQLLSLRGRTAIVTGGSRGLGEAMVHRLAQAGANVAFTGRHAETLREVEQAVKDAGGVAVGIESDASTLEDSRQLVDGVIGQFGRLDILVNNAAVFEGSVSLDVSPEHWDKAMETDLRGAFFLSQLAAKAMIAGGRGGRIINLLSIDAFRPKGFLVAYDAAKAGLWAVTTSMANELAEHGILVNAVAPGATITAERIAAMQDGTLGGPPLETMGEKTRRKMQAMMAGGNLAQRLQATAPLGHPGYPDDIAKAVLFLASPMAGYVSGICLTVDGGQSLR